MRWICFLCSFSPVQRAKLHQLVLPEVIDPYSSFLSKSERFKKDITIIDSLLEYKKTDKQMPTGTLIPEVVSEAQLPCLQSAGDGALWALPSTPIIHVFQHMIPGKSWSPSWVPATAQRTYS